ncbi:SDR family NAD(P)-dependent oxidoreductase [Elongatibacter sediminis]|uniref:SDR family NAD(P)-dependent oxidoreductase n=1 Tax=Elongatibacter sediminis TaxID=3119006 RepID=A0AAW9RFY6_9GAMM
MTTRDLVKIITFYGRFTPNYTKIGYWARRPFWGAGPKLDFSGQTWLVTGASLGLGAAMMKVAAEGGARVIAVARSQERLEAARARLKPDAQQRVQLETADMSLVSGTADLQRRLVESGAKFDVIQNNVGLLLNELTITPEGKESSFVTNVLSHYQLTEGLHDAGALADRAVIVNMTSGGMYNAPLGYRGLNTTSPEKYNGKVSYAYAKRAQVALTVHWNKKWGGEGIRCYVTHPGWSKTPGVKTALPIFWKIQNFILRTPRQGADTALWLVAAQPPIGEETVWFDRKPRPTHMYAFTHKSQCTIDELVEYLEGELKETAAG